MQARAEALGLPVRHPVSLKGAEAQAEFAALGADVAVVVAYGLILPQAVLDAPRLGCLNIHASLLPRWRGAAPIHRAIMAGDAETGVCIMQMEAGLDTGPVLLREAMAIGAEETTADLHDRLSAMGARLIVQALAIAAAARSGTKRTRRHLCQQDRQGRGAGGLDAPGGRGGSADPRPVAVSRGLVRGRGRAGEAAALASGHGAGRSGAGSARALPWPAGRVRSRSPWRSARARSRCRPPRC